jgi:hypothetical protein
MGGGGGVESEAEQALRPRRRRWAPHQVGSIVEPKRHLCAAPAAPAFLPDPGGKLALERELAKPVLSSVSVARAFRNRDRYG